MCSWIFFFSTPSLAKKPVALTLSPPSQNPEKIFENYSKVIENIKTLSAEIIQTNPNGTKMHAKFYLHRPQGKPGEMRLVYDLPSKVQIMAAKGLLVHYDGQRDHSQSMALANSPVAFLLLGHLRDHVILMKIIRHYPQTTLVMKSKKDPNAGTIHLVFNDEWMKNPTLFPLVGWSLTDAYGKTTHIALHHTKKNIAIPKGAFEFRK